jgi:hypothetical protein
VAEQVAAGGPAAVCHHGPLRQDCPVECLQAVLSQAPYRALARAQGACFPPPRTVADVIRLYARRDLRDIRGLGPRRISEIETALVLAGFDLSAHQLPLRQPADAPLTGDTDSLLPDPAAATARPTVSCPVCGAPADFPPRLRRPALPRHRAPSRLRSEPRGSSPGWPPTAIGVT